MKKELLEQIGSELTIQQNFVETSFPSIFSKQDVLKVLDTYTEAIFATIQGMKEQGPVMSLEGIQDLSEQLMSAISRRVDRLEAEEVVDYSSACFSINYSNTVEIDSIDYMSDTITQEVENAVDEVLHDYFTSKEEEAVAETPYATEQ
jgi:hypothetical protein